MKRKWLPDNVTEYKDRHGKPRFRFRKKGLPTYHFKHAPGTQEFMAEYHAAKGADKPISEHFKPGTIDALCVSYMSRPSWFDVTEDTQRRERARLDKLRAKTGEIDVGYFKTEHIDGWLSDMKDTPAAANKFRKTLLGLFRHAVKLGWIDQNPVEAADRFKVKTKGFYSWTEADIAQFRGYWKNGTRQRLAMELMLNTGLRSKDACKLGRNAIKAGKFHVHHNKNNASAGILVFPETRKAIESMEVANITFVVTEYGRPFSTKGFGNWFNAACKKAGLPKCTCHGLKKAFARRLAEAGATDQQGQAATGHKTPGMFGYYAKEANKGALADAAMANVRDKFAKKD